LVMISSENAKQFCQLKFGFSSLAPILRQFSHVKSLNGNIWTIN